MCQLVGGCGARAVSRHLFTLSVQHQPSTIASSRSIPYSMCFIILSARLVFILCCLDLQQRRINGALLHQHYCCLFYPSPSPSSSSPPSASTIFQLLVRNRNKMHMGHISYFSGQHCRISYVCDWQCQIFHSRHLRLALVIRVTKTPSACQQC